MRTPYHADQNMPAVAELPKSYTPRTAESEVRAKWDAANTFHADPNAPSEPYCILIPPPNVTAALHLGHAFNNSLQDVLIRFHRMKGFKTLWMPGTDHAGIATQAVVEKRLLLEGRRRTDFSRDQFVEKVQAWKDEYEATIIDQLKVMGCSCDFDRSRFTMDEVCAKAVREAFFRLFKDGLIYRGKRLVNWDPVSQTALADDEVEMEEVAGHMWYLKYPVIDFDSHKAHGVHAVGFVTVATTRPETMLGDTAVAINPRDPRAAQFVGKKIKLPIVDRIIPIIADDYVVRPVQYGGDESDAKSKIATGFLKVTPAHDPNDYEIGKRHDLPIINVMAPDATISDKHGWTDVSPEAKQFLGSSREDARKQIVQWFKEHNLLEDVKPYSHSVGHSYRSHVPIEPYLSDQWYVSVTDDRLKGEALRAMAREQYECADAEQRAGASSPPSATAAVRSDAQHGAGDGPARNGDYELRFFPPRYAKTFQSWHENLRDWCISRQLWWGHRIPVWRRTRWRIHHTDGIEHQHLKLQEWIDSGRVVAIYPSGDDVENLSPLERMSLKFQVNICVRDPEGEDKPIVEALHAAEWAQDPDVLDTWFSSALWPISTMGWPDPEVFSEEIPEGSALLNTFNPSSTLCTAREIITLWVSRMVMFNRYFRDEKLPFKDVYVHAMIQDGYGQKMSKSLGNGVDPRDIIHSHGADAMRFTLVQLATNTQDVRLPVDMICPHPGCEHTFHPKEITSPAGYRVADVEQTCPACKKKMISGYGAATGLAKPTSGVPLARNSSSKFDEGRNFANKLWNATRFALSNLPERESQLARSLGQESQGFARLNEFSLVDRWIVTRLHRTMHIIEDALADYQFKVYADAMYDFIWRDFCDWYLEIIKPTVRTNPVQQQVLRTVLNASMRMLHPIMPFVTETLWPHVNACGFAGLDGINLPESDLCATAAWPDINCSVDDEQALKNFERVQTLTNAIRTVRAERQVSPKKKIRLAASREVLDLIKSAHGVVETLAGLEAVEPITNRPADAIPLAFEGGELLLSGLVDAVDATAERARLTKVITEKEKQIAGFRGKLSNEGYLGKAPPDKVEETRKLLAQAEADLAAAHNALQSLQ